MDAMVGLLRRSLVDWELSLEGPRVRVAPPAASQRMAATSTAALENTLKVLRPESSAISALSIT